MPVRNPADARALGDTGHIHDPQRPTTPPLPDDFVWNNLLENYVVAEGEIVVNTPE